MQQCICEDSNVVVDDGDVTADNADLCRHMTMAVHLAEVLEKLHVRREG